MIASFISTPSPLLCVSECHCAVSLFPRADLDTATSMFDERGTGHGAS